MNDLGAGPPEIPPAPIDLGRPPDVGSGAAPRFWTASRAPGVLAIAGLIAGILSPFFPFVDGYPTHVLGHQMAEDIANLLVREAPQALLLILAIVLLLRTDRWRWFAAGALVLSGANGLVSLVGYAIGYHVYHDHESAGYWLSLATNASAVISGAWAIAQVWRTSPW